MYIQENLQFFVIISLSQYSLGMMSLCFLLLGISAHIPHLYAQYTQLWFDDMDDNNGWAEHNSVDLPRNSDGCYSYPQGGQCAALNAENGPSWIQCKQDGMLSYSMVQFQFDLWGWDLESNDECQVIYCYASSSSCLDSSSNIFSYPNEANEATIVSFGSPTNDRIWIRLKIDGDSSSKGDKCYFDTVYLRGIPAPQPTTRSPTKRPTPAPVTPQPTPRPTPNPTPNPTPKLSVLGI